MTEHETIPHQFALTLVQSASQPERIALAKWANDLLRLRDSNLGPLDKAHQAIGVTLDAEVIWPAIKVLGSEIKRIGWDERSLPAKIGLSGVALAASVFSGKGAGIAALGGAIGVPLWVVFGAGGAFVGVLIEEISRINESRQTEVIIEKEVSGEVLADYATPQDHDPHDRHLAEPKK